MQPGDGRVESSLRSSVTCFFFFRRILITHDGECGCDGVGERRSEKLSGTAYELELLDVMGVATGTAVVPYYRFSLLES